MRKRWAVVAASALLGIGFTAGRVISQDAGKEGEKPGKPEAGEKREMTPEEKAEMEAWQKYMTPGEAHAKMAAHAGEWNVAGKFWMGSSEPTVSSGTAKFRMILGGRYEVQEYSGAFMGMPFEGMGLRGFDNYTKEYTSVWVDSMGTGVMVTKGKADEKGTIAMKGEMVDPQAGAMAVRHEMAEKDKDSFVFTMYGKGPKHPEEMKVMELVYTRKK